MKKLKNILLATTFGLSFGQGYSQTSEYYFGNPNDPKSEIKKVDKETFFKIWNSKNYSYGMKDFADKSGSTRWYVVPKTNINAQTTQGKSSSSTYQVSPNKTITEKKYTPNTSNPNYFTPKTNKNSDLDNLLIGGAVLGGVLILNELFKPRQKNYISPVQPIDNPPAQPIYKSPSESSWDWQDKKSEESLLEKKSGVIKRVDEDFWGEIKDKKLESKKIANERSKELSDFVEKQIEYSPETKKKLEEEAKISDEYFKEIGMNPGAQVKYKVVGTAEIGPNGELIKKDSYSPARELTPEEKVILYYAYNLSKNYTSAGPVIKGVETINKLEKEVDFLFTKPIGDNTYSYFKLAGKEDYFVMKNSPYGDAIINLADFKEKTEKATNWWDK